MTSGLRPWRIAIVDDNPEDRAEVKALLLRGSWRRYDFVEAQTGEAGLEICRTEPLPDCLILDYHLPDRNALEILEALPRAGAADRSVPAIPVVVLTGSVRGQSARALVHAGAQDFIGKEWTTADSLTHAVENAVERHALEMDLARAASSLTEREAFNRSLMDGSADCLKVLDQDGRLLHMNEPGLCQMEIDDFEAYRGRLWEELWPVEARDELRAAVVDAQSGQASTFQAFCPTAKGNPRWWEVTVSPVRDREGGRVVRLLSASRDITAAHQAREALRENEHRLRLALEGAEMGMWDWDMDTDEVGWSPQCYTIHGVAPDAFDGTGAGFGRLLHPEDAERVWSTVRRAAAEHRSYYCEFRIVRPGGEVRWVTNRGRALLDPDGRAQRMIGIIADITDRKQLDTEREHLLTAERAARAEADRVARIKDEFLATLSHELRTPLNAIVGWAQILRRMGKDARVVEEGIEVIARNAQAQAQLINDLLDMNRIISGKLKMEIDLVHPNLVAASAVDTVRPAAEAKGVRLDLHLGQGLGQVRGDANRLQQVLWNLLTNAVKFTPAGGSVELSTETSGDGIRFVVADSGQGIAPDFLPYLFDRFSQADNSAARKHGGLGLGLSIVRQIVELHAGTVTAESEGAGCGSRFIVSLPLAERVGYAGPGPKRPIQEVASAVFAGADEADSIDVDLRGVSVLLVDDQVDALEMTRRILTEGGATVAVATSAREALDHLLRSSPDVLLSDIGMPDMDGYRLIRTVREGLGRGSQDLPAAALTAFARAEDIERTLEAGFQAHLGKPLRPQLLLETVAALARGGRRPPA